MARILVIDDEADMRALLAQTLKAAGHEVVLAAEGEEGMRLYRAEPADIVITDLYMPHQEGIETIKKLRKEFPDAVIIAMSGKDGASALLSVAKRLGAVAVLEKPFVFEQLIVIVERLLVSSWSE